MQDLVMAFEQLSQINDEINARESFDYPGAQRRLTLDYEFEGPRYSWYSSVYSRTEGRYLPIYETEMDLRAIRMAAWLLDAEVLMSQAFINRLADYTIANGFDWQVKHTSPKIAEKCRRIIQRVLDNSQWNTLERESFRREIVEGEFIARCEKSCGDMALNVVETDSLTEPAFPKEIEDWQQMQSGVLDWKFGIATRPRSSRPVGYHFVFDQAGSEWDYSPASEVVHWKRNVPLAAKRGISDFYWVYSPLRHTSKLYTNTAIGAQLQAAIAYIVEHGAGANSKAVERLIANRKLDDTGASAEAIRYGREGSKRVKPGHVVDLYNGAAYKPSNLGSTANNVFIEVMEAGLRFAGAMHGFPEHFLTGYAGNNNMASSVEAKSPFVQGRLADQGIRSQRLRVLFCSILYWELGRDEWTEIAPGLDVAITLPKIVDNNNVELTGALVAQKEQGWINDRQAVNLLGYDWDEIQATQDGDSQEDESSGTLGALGGLKRSQYKNNRKAISEILKEYEAGDIERAQAEVILGSLGLSESDISKLLQEQVDTIKEEVSRTVKNLLRAWEEYP